MYSGFRHPAEIISHAVWLYHRFTLSFRNVDEVFIRIKGKPYYLWRAVDQDGDVLDILVQPRRNAKAAKRFFRKLLKGSGYSPRIIVTDKLKSYSAAHRELGIGAEHETGRYRNNRAENSHQPTRQKERQMRGFKSVQQAQRLLWAQGPIGDLFRHDRHLMSARSYRELWAKGFEEWKIVTGVVPAI